MIIKIDEKSYFGDSGIDKTLGYIGEQNAREVIVEHPIVEGANTYRLRIRYNDGVSYDVPIVDNKFTVSSSLLREVGTVSCQWIATKAAGDIYEMAAKSNIFSLVIGESIGDDVTPIPPYEVSQAALDEVLNIVSELDIDGLSNQEIDILTQQEAE